MVANDNVGLCKNCAESSSNIESNGMCFLCNKDGLLSRFVDKRPKATHAIKGPPVELDCFVCKKKFKVIASRARKRKEICCSLECRVIRTSAIKTQKVKRECCVCKKEIWYKKSHAEKIKFHTCSMKCSSKWRSIHYVGNKNANYRHGDRELSIFNERAASCTLRASKRGLKSDIDGEFLRKLYKDQGGLCFYTGVKMNIAPNVKEKDFTFSVDRIDSKLGYMKNNVVLCLNIANRFKGDCNMEKFKEILASIWDKINSNTLLKVKKLTNTAKTPEKGTLGAAGFDMFVDRIEEFDTYIKVYTGIAIEPPLGYYYLLMSRSSAYKQGLSFYTGLGLIDNDYRGEIIAIFEKTQDYKQAPKQGDRIVQLVPQKTIKVSLVEVSELSSTERNNGGFGSTGA
jgi:dUTP pyrophosphatase